MTNETHHWAKNGGNLAVEIRKSWPFDLQHHRVAFEARQKGMALSLVLTGKKRVLYPLSTVEGVLHFNK